MRLNLKGRNGTGSLVLELNSEVLAANSSVFADLIAEYRRSSKGMCRIEVPEIENVNIFRETVELMFDGDITTRLLKIGVYRVIDILEVCIIFYIKVVLLMVFFKFLSVLLHTIVITCRKILIVNSDYSKICLCVFQMLCHD